MRNVGQYARSSDIVTRKEFQKGRSQWNVTEHSKKKRTGNRQLDLAVRRSLLTSEKAGSDWA